MKKLLLLSGGIDSTVAAHLLKKQGVDVHCLSLKTTTNKDNKDEIRNAQNVAAKLGFEHTIISTDFLREVYRDQVTVFSVGGSAGGCLIDTQRPFTLCVELMHVIALAVAGELGASAVVWALNKDDLASVDRNEHRKYLELINEIVVLRAERDIKIELPLSSMTKIEVINLGVELNADITQTVSCINGLPTCGKCRQCLNVEQALRSSGVFVD